ncbi:MAG: VOC family protein [Archangium sp.]|nr:VOC family protein [Archangium sp.]
MLHHVSLGVLHLERATRFYDAALAPLGYSRVWTTADAAGYDPHGPDEKLALKRRDGAAPPGAGFHLALAAPSRAAVDDFFRAVVANGGRDNGAPGLRPHYGPSYYAAFVIDPDGYHLEAVFKAVV